MNIPTTRPSERLPVKCDHCGHPEDWHYAQISLFDVSHERVDPETLFPCYDDPEDPASDCSCTDMSPRIDVAACCV
jgi:hypothetical protein